MINFFSETEFELQDQDFYKDWLNACVDKRNYSIGTINYVFCDDAYLLEINQKHLSHDYYTDIITFDYTEEKNLIGDIFISVDRIADNAHEYASTFDDEIARVMVHGLLHMMGLNDDTDENKQQMRLAESECLNFLYHIDEEE